VPKGGCPAGGPAEHLGLVPCLVSVPPHHPLEGLLPAGARHAQDAHRACRGGREAGRQAGEGRGREESRAARNFVLHCNQAHTGTEFNSTARHGTARHAQRDTAGHSGTQRDTALHPLHPPRSPPQPPPVILAPNRAGSSPRATAESCSSWARATRRSVPSAKGEEVRCHEAERMETKDMTCTWLSMQNAAPPLIPPTRLLPHPIY